MIKNYSQFNSYLNDQTLPPIHQGQNVPRGESWTASESWVIINYYLKFKNAVINNVI